MALTNTGRCAIGARCVSDVAPLFNRGHRAELFRRVDYTGLTFSPHGVTVLPTRGERLPYTEQGVSLCRCAGNGTNKERKMGNDSKVHNGEGAGQAGPRAGLSGHPAARADDARDIRGGEGHAPSWPGASAVHRRQGEYAHAVAAMSTKTVVDRLLVAPQRGNIRIDGSAFKRQPEKALVRL